MKTSENGISFIMSKEALSLTSYQDVAGYWTVGYGHMGNPAAPDVTITQSEAIKLLRSDILPVEKFINEKLMINDQNKFDALVSLIFNIGIGNFSKSLTCSLVKADPRNLAIAFEWIEFISSGGKRYRGLLLRRLDELKVYFS